MVSLGSISGTEVFGKYNANLCTITIPEFVNMYIPGMMCCENLHNYAQTADCKCPPSGLPTEGYSYTGISYTTYDTCGGGASPGNGSSGSGSGVITTSPHGGGSLPDLLGNPCEKLKQLLNTPTSLPPGAVSIKTALVDLKTKNMATATHEDGYSFFYDPANGQMYAKKVTTYTADNTVEYVRTPNTFGGAHTHMNSLQGIFSHDDIMMENNFFFWFTSVPQGSVDVPIPVHIVVANNEVYALALEDANISAFQQMMYEIYSDEFKRRKFRNNFEADFSNLQNSVTGEWNTDNSILEERFLKFVTSIDNSTKHYNTKVSLYKSNASLTGWDKLSIVKNSNVFEIKKLPCQ
ncbi:hypothetical protein ASG22_08105 [Chryseobacterium sp. Leaf405]|uniref:hypothetical protein n=1 Tax=Chryseobacterium sp. Leaf405 TaxID=1736367 RepID=UPI0006F57991|nr:hypothetical protein [Chryseobacterium sp. Leaf405]KQT23977.1 hypothetical protein ASG22_08105 [Chryseobacterium sp. Leaf405]